MPNIQGGKKYKSTKHHHSDSVEMHEINEADGQMLGRVLRALGNRRMLLHCNDGTERICKIRNAIVKKVRITVGDVVLISIREDTDSKGDILAKYDTSLFSKLKKIPGVNQNLFLTLEEAKTKEDEGFQFESGAGDESEEESSAEGSVNVEDI